MHAESTRSQLPETNCLIKLPFRLGLAQWKPCYVFEIVFLTIYILYIYIGNIVQ